MRIAAIDIGTNSVHVIVCEIRPDLSFEATPRKSHAGFGQLRRARRRAVRVLGAIVRLAEGLDRSHAQVVSRLDGVLDTQGWLIIQLHAAGDAELEMSVSDRHAGPLASLFNREIRFAIVQQAETIRRALAEPVSPPSVAVDRP